MGIFDGILICSDWDGTLFCDGEVPERTREAISYFMAEGGKFAITSGRDADFLYRMRHFINPNTYCICYGGSLVCDIESGEELLRGSLGAGAFEALDKILDSEIEITRINVFCEGEIKHYTKEEYYEFGKAEALAAHSFKITLNCKTDEDGERLVAFCDSLGSEEFIFVRSFASYLEIIDKRYTKGTSARLIKEKTGARALVGMGDYENDLALFEGCDISFAVANATPSLKNIATHVTRATVRECAAAEIIATLEEMLQAGEL